MREKVKKGWSEISVKDRALKEPVAAYGADSLFDPQDVIDTDEGTPRELKTLPGDILQPIIKWAGGKSRELKFIIPNAPGYNNYYEPFVGGGSVYTALEADHFFINDLSEELISLYHYISTQDPEFFMLAEDIALSWQRAHSFFLSYKDEIRGLYEAYRRNASNDRDSLKESVSLFCQKYHQAISGIPGERFRAQSALLLTELSDTLCRKLIRTKTLETERNILPEEDLDSTIETIVKGSLYMYYRKLYNDDSFALQKSTLHCALFLFIRNYCYSGMFRYNDYGEFNVPYGGIGYNGKSLSKKIAYYRSLPLINKFKRTSIYNLDFEEFLRTVKPGAEDFVFLDPPYDSEFSTYAKNEFGKDDQKRLADYLINDCRAKWMLIIKNTEYVLSLYEGKKGVIIRSFDKKYMVSFMNRNDRQTEHLLITNYI